MTKNNYEKLLGEALSLHQQGMLSEASNLYQSLIDLDHENPDAWHLLGFASFQLGENQRAIDLISRAISIDDSIADFHINLADAFRMNGQLDKASSELLTALKLQSDSARAHSMMGLVAHESNNFITAIDHHKKATAIEPTNAEHYFNLARSYQSNSERMSAVDTYKKCLSLQPAHTGANANLSILMLDLGYAEDAQTYSLAAINSNPENANLHNNHGIVLQSTGYREEAKKAFETALRLNPNLASAYLHLSEYMGSSTSDKFINQVNETLKSSSLSTHDKPLRNFSLAKIQLSCKQITSAFKSLDTAHTILSDTEKFSLDEHSVGCWKTIEIQNQLKNNASRQSSSPDHSPIFVIGMPRSGTTLVEQILGAHHSVTGLGELPYMPELARRLYNNPDYSLSVLAHEYLDKCQAHNLSTHFLVDKLPYNYLYIGLISALFPDSWIIHCKRNPIDTCLSCYTNYFPDPHPFTHKLNDLAGYYQVYEEIMAHWESRDACNLLEIKYEDLVTNPRDSITSILNTIGLDNDELCYSHEKNSSIVRTNSDLQSRQPIYTSSVNKWIKYKDHLEPLIRQLSE